MLTQRGRERERQEEETKISENAIAREVGGLKMTKKSKAREQRRSGVSELIAAGMT